MGGCRPSMRQRGWYRSYPYSQLKLELPAGPQHRRGLRCHVVSDRIGAATMAPHVTARRSNASPSTPTGTLAERYDRGVGLRQKTPRKKHADLLGPTD